MSGGSELKYEALYLMLVVAVLYTCKVALEVRCGVTVCLKGRIRIFGLRLSPTLKTKKASWVESWDSTARF